MEAVLGIFPIGIEVAFVALVAASAKVFDHEVNMV